MAIQREKSVAAIRRERDRLAAEAARQQVSPPRGGAKRRPARPRPGQLELEHRVERVGPWLAGDAPEPLEPPAELLVLTWAHLHGHVLGVSAVPELAGRAWSPATAAAHEMLRDRFGGALPDAVEFIRWAWRRESGRIAERRRRGEEPGRLTWQRVFRTPGLVVDYRVARANGGD